MEYLKEVRITPEKVLAGDSVEFTIQLVVGKDFTAQNSRIILDTPAYLGTSRPTLHHQELSGAVEIICSNPDILYKKRMWNMETGDFSNEAPTMGEASARSYRMLVIDFEGGTAAEGDMIEIKWGYIPNGFSCGTKVTSLVLKKEFYNTVHVRYFKDASNSLPDYGRSFQGYQRPVPDQEHPLSFQVLPREPQQMRLIRRQEKACLLIQDRFYNICPMESAENFIKEAVAGTVNDFGVSEYSPDVVITPQDLPFYNTPHPRKINGEYNIYFGDLHTHSSVSVDCIEREKLEITPEQSIQFARDVACLDFVAITDHHQHWDTERYKIGEENWSRLNKVTEKYTQNGEFLAFAGFEYRCERGDTTVVLNETLTYAEMNLPQINNIKDLWRQYQGRKYITIPHFHNPGSLEEDCWYPCPYEGIEPVLEIYSCHGSYEHPKTLERGLAEVKVSRPDRNGKYFLQSGYRYGYICNSDGHKGNTGFNGLTAVYAKQLTKDAVIEAIVSRRVYGTTNARIRLLFTMNNHLMGAVLPNTEEKQLHLSIMGERPFKAVDIFRNGELYRRFKPYEFSFETDLVIEEKDNSNWYVRAIQTDNHMAWSSPIWFE